MALYPKMILYLYTPINSICFGSHPPWCMRRRRASLCGFRSSGGKSSIDVIACTSTVKGYFSTDFTVRVQKKVCVYIYICVCVNIYIYIYLSPFFSLVMVGFKVSKSGLDALFVTFVQKLDLDMFSKSDDTSIQR